MAHEDCDAQPVLKPHPSDQSDLSSLSEANSPAARRLKLSRMVLAPEGIVKLRSLKKSAQRRAYRIAKRKDARAESDPEERRLQSLIDDIGCAIPSKWVATRGDDGKFSPWVVAAPPQ